MRKGVYPYEYMNTWDRFTELKLPLKEAFYSKLSDAHISGGDYTHAQKVWATICCKTLGDYSDLYCRTDVLLLVDVFETFRKMCLRQYGIDPTHYYTNSGISWYALLKKIRVELELLTDYDQHLFIGKAMRGGISMASKRHAEANNPLFEIKTEDLFQDIAQKQTLNDISDYPKDHPLYSSANKTVLGKLKDECAGRAITEYVGLCPKMYSILEACRKNTKKAKGVKKNVVKKHIRHEHYKEALFERQTFRHGMDVLRSERHRIYGQHLNKVSLSPSDSKRWIAKNGMDMLAYGHRDTGCQAGEGLDAYIKELFNP